MQNWYNVPLTVFSSKKFIVGVSVIDFRVLSRNNFDKRPCAVLELVPLRGEQISSNTHKTGSCYLSWVVFNISDEHPCHCYMGVPSQTKCYSL